MACRISEVTLRWRIWETSSWLLALILWSAVAAASASAAQTDPAPAYGAAAPAIPPADTAPLQSVVNGGELTTAHEKEEDRNSVLDTYPLPVLLTIIIAATALVSALVSVIVTPWTMRKIAADQRQVADKAADAAVMSASAANENAKAAGKSAEAAVLNANAAAQNTTNLGIHQVARLRQEWINDLRNELAALHSLLSNWMPPLEDSAGGVEASTTRVRDANTRLARVEMLLNPREVESRRLVEVLKRVAGDTSPDGVKRRRRARWIVRWGQIVLKTEWDRVRAELNGFPPPSPRRRLRSRRKRPQSDP